MEVRAVLLRQSLYAVTLLPARWKNTCFSYSGQHMMLSVLIFTRLMMGNISQCSFNLHPSIISKVDHGTIFMWFSTNSPFMSLFDSLMVFDPFHIALEGTLCVCVLKYKFNKVFDCVLIHVVYEISPPPHLCEPSRAIMVSVSTRHQLEKHRFRASLVQHCHPKVKNEVTNYPLFIKTAKFTLVHRNRSVIPPWQIPRNDIKPRVRWQSEGTLDTLQKVNFCSSMCIYFITHLLY